MTLVWNCLAMFSRIQSSSSSSTVVIVVVPFYGYYMPTANPASRRALWRRWYRVNPR